MTIHLPPFGPDLPVHPFTGLTALGLRRNGAPIWPVRGGSGEGDPAEPAKPPASDPPEGGQGDLGDAGKQAIDRMKAERNAARKELTELKTQLAELAPLKKLADALGAQQPAGDDGKTDFEGLADRLAKHEEELKSERLARFRAEVAAEKGLTPAQAKRLIGTTREEFAADADELLKTFPAAPADGGRGGRNPRPDPSQGSRGGKPLTGRDAGLAEAQKRFGVKSAAT